MQPKLKVYVLSCPTIFMLCGAITHSPARAAKSLMCNMSLTFTLPNERLSSVGSVESTILLLIKCPNALMTLKFFLLHLATEASVIQFFYSLRSAEQIVLRYKAWGCSVGRYGVNKKQGIGSCLCTF